MYRLERIAFNLRISLLCMSFFKFEFIQGDLDKRTRLDFKGACLSALKNF